MNSHFPLARRVARTNSSVIGNCVLGKHVPDLRALCRAQRDAELAAPAQAFPALQENLR
jgi:hypothetical protein